jgi:hypothetical protein
MCLADNWVMLDTFREPAGRPHGGFWKLQVLYKWKPSADPRVLFFDRKRKKLLFDRLEGIHEPESISDMKGDLRVFLTCEDLLKPWK